MNNTAGQVSLGLVIALMSLLFVSLFDTLEPGWSSGFRNGIDWLYIKFWVLIAFGLGAAGMVYILYALFTNKAVRAWFAEHGEEIWDFLKIHKKIVFITIAVLALVVLITILCVIFI